MPYSRRRNAYRKKRYNKSAWYDRKYSTLDLAKKSWAAVKYLKSVINVEKKKHDTSSSGSISSAGGIQLLSNIAQGDTDQTRDGNSIKMQSMLLRATFTLNASATASNMRDRKSVV